MSDGTPLFSKPPIGLLTDPRLTPTEKIVGVMLFAYRRSKKSDARYGQAWPSESTLAYKLGLDERTIRRCLRRLQATGWIQIVLRSTLHLKFKARGRSLAYVVNEEPTSWEEPGRPQRERKPDVRVRLAGSVIPELPALGALPGVTHDSSPDTGVRVGENKPGADAKQTGHGCPVLTGLGRPVSEPGNGRFAASEPRIELDTPNLTDEPNSASEGRAPAPEISDDGFLTLVQAFESWQHRSATGRECDGLRQHLTKLGAGEVLETIADLREEGLVDPGPFWTSVGRRSFAREAA